VAIVDTKKLSYEEFLVSHEDVHAEWVDGTVVVMSPASTLHQDLLGFLSAILRNFVEEKELGKILTTPVQMKLSPRPSSKQSITTSSSHQTPRSAALVQGLRWFLSARAA
jgi:Uma2 family endonuclease